VVTGYSPVVARTARRLPTSAIETNCEHNRSIDRAPHTTPESPPAQLSLRVAEAHFRAQPAEISRARDRHGLPIHGFFPPRSLAAEASPQPDWLGHLLSQTWFRRKPEKPPPKMPPKEGYPQARRARPRSRESLTLKGRLTHPPAKESAFRRTRGAFHRQAHPRKSAP